MMLNVDNYLPSGWLIIVELDVIKYVLLGCINTCHHFGNLEVMELNPRKCEKLVRLLFVNLNLNKCLDLYRLIIVKLNVKKYNNFKQLIIVELNLNISARHVIHEEGG